MCMNESELRVLAQVDGDTPLLLGIAAKIAFPDGSMTENGLKREIACGRLAVERIAGKKYTTLNDIRRMRERCRENQWGSANTSGSEKGGRLSGSSSMAEMKSAQDAAKTIALQLIASSKATSPKSISRNGGAEIRTK
ncbi:excisionase [Rhizobium leguminosarum]|uniref:excisionase n=1 Tax=Rhizobium leguminosarum TaxID=384 RepID=UPI001981346F|nr:excisionase [Rhizobium leguminosarum]